MAGSDTAAIALLCRAVELDGKRRKTEALVCYKEGLQLLMNVIQDMKTGGNEAKLSAYRSKASQYMQRAEQLSLQIEEDKRTGKFHEQYKLEGGSTGHSYQTLFGRFLDEDVTQVGSHVRQRARYRGISCPCRLGKFTKFFRCFKSF